MTEPDYNNYIQKLDADIRDNNYPPVILARVVFMNYLKEAFNGREDGDYHYSSDPIVSEILIKDHFQKNEDTPQKKPMIILSRGPLMATDGTIANNMLSYRLEDDSTKHVDQLVTAIVFQCIGSNIIESEYIASIVFGVLRYFKEEIRSRGLIAVRGFRIDPPEPSAYYDQSTQIEAFQTNVHCQVFMYDRWTERWKTDKEIEQYIERTGVDPRAINFPPRVVQDIGVTITEDTDD